MRAVVSPRSAQRAVLRAGAMLAISLAAPAWRAEAGSTYYVGPSGTNDPSSGRGSSPDTPWRTINFGVQQVPDDDSTIVVLDGVYRNPAVDLGRVFSTHLTLKAARPYRAILINTGGQPAIFS